VVEYLLGHFALVISVAKENRELLLKLAPEVLDPVLIPSGFRRSQRSLVYSRSFPRTKQELCLSFDTSPRYAPESKMHLHAAVCIKMAEVAKTACEMTGDSFRFGRSDIVISQPMDILIPKTENRRWLISDYETCRLALEEVAAFFPRWVEPFLRDYTSPDELVRQYEAGDRRPIQQHHFYVFVAACYLLRGQRDKAAQVLARHLGKPGLRKIYGRAFDSVAS
jgi:hypothetical protein